jgi:hypothetical protein
VSNVLTLAEIEQLYPSEWILIEDPQTNESLQVEAGRVCFHSKDRDEVYRKLVELRPKHFAVHFSGEIPEDVVVIL